MTLRKDEFHFFKDIGYYHPGYMQCDGANPKCKCLKDKKNISESGWYSCLYPWFKYEEKAWKP
jgi:hypothetical protein